MMLIQAALQWANTQLSASSDVPKLEAEVLLAHTLNVTRSHLHAWPNRELTTTQEQVFMQAIQRAEQGEPIAHIVGLREFWSLELLVTPDALIPRPETELLIEWILAILPAQEVQTIADLGTGCGGIALALAKERPHWQIYATDLVPATLAIAKQNAARLQIPNIEFCLGAWCDALPKLKFDAILSNPPYIAEGDSNISPEVARFEPAIALYSGPDGLEALRTIIHQAPAYLKPNGCLLVEHGSQQALAVVDLFTRAGYVGVQGRKDLAGLDRAIIGHFSPLP